MSPTESDHERARASVLERLRIALAAQYTVEREIGSGGMAIVYLAHDLRHDRSVALKVLRKESSGWLDRERFQHEIHFAARLQHPHILTVLDSGEVTIGDGAKELWFTMPFVDGESLRDRLNRDGQLPLDAALRIATEAARALDYAHQQGVIHRDVKPENILLTRDGSTLVTDFGIARPLGVDHGLTQTGRLLGTPAYMSPEQVDGAQVDARTDQYALALVLYEMLAGEPAFAGRSLSAIVASRLDDPTPSVRTVRGNVTAEVDNAIQKALAPAASDRFDTMTQFAQAFTTSPNVSTPGGATPPPTARPRGARRQRSGERAMVIASALLVATGAFIAWREHAKRSVADSGGHVVAVLPFDNLGDSVDVYFADGVADEVRTKLAHVAGLEVIARGSSIEYRQTTRRPTDIARELGAQYLLTGTVRWDKTAQGNRVRVTPELVDARAGHAARTRWVQEFDASLTDVFQVQADIASKVVDALGVALADSTRRELRSQPTANLGAYDQFLKGEAVSGMMKGDQASLRQAIGFYERAVALDSGFAVAWAQLSRAKSSLYSNGVPSPELGEQARLAGERAQRLAPRDPTGYLALGDFYGSVNPVDNQRAAAEYEKGLAIDPRNVELLGAAAVTETSLGRWDGVAARLARAGQLDPRSANSARRLAVVQTFLHNYAAADSAADRAVALAPTNAGMVSMKVLVALARGDLDSARAVIRASIPAIDAATLLPFFANYQDLYWVLDDEQQREVLKARPSAFDDDRASWGIVQTELYHFRGDRARAAAYADSARLAIEAQIREAPNDWQRHALRGLMLAYLGRKEEAIREGQQGVKLMPISQDAYFGPYVQLQLVRIYLLVGEPEKAIEQLEPLLRTPFYVTPGWLRIDPTFDPLRGNPRFRKLVAEAN